MDLTLRTHIRVAIPLQAFLSISLSAFDICFPRLRPSHSEFNEIPLFPDWDLAETAIRDVYTS